MINLMINLIINGNYLFITLIKRFLCYTDEPLYDSFN